jgi:exodeoxyribonuclease-5
MSLDTKTQITAVLLAHLRHQPTMGQRDLAERLANFMVNSSTGDTYIIKGYAGTGKTTMVSALVKTVSALSARAVLLAPTGRAAKVMAGYAGRSASTIHRRIYQMEHSDGGGFSMKLSPNKSKNTFFIVDEASMIPEKQSGDGMYARSLLKDLVDFVSSGEGCRLILVGDTAQLPPVGEENSPALDVRYMMSRFGMRAGHFELTQVVRQEHESGILLNATALRNQVLDNTEFKFKVDLPDVVRLSAADVGEQLSQDHGTYGTDQVMVVCRSNRSANNYNRQIRFGSMWFTDEINAGDFLMCTKNNYFWMGEESGPSFIANGDMLRVVRVNGFSEMYGFRFANLSLEFIDVPNAPAFDAQVNLDSLHTDAPSLTSEQSNRLYVAAAGPPEGSKSARAKRLSSDPYFQALQVKFGYAVTCHKAQGGQWRAVYVDQGYLTEEMIDRNYWRWLYTALTRATEKLYLVNFSDRFFDH